jgi:hypothetical protein
MASDAADPEFPELAHDTPLRRQVFAGLLAHRDRLSPFELNELWHACIFDSRDDVLARAGDIPAALVFHAGEYRAGLAAYERQLEPHLTAPGALAGAVGTYANKGMVEAASASSTQQAESNARAIAQAERVDPGALVHFACRAAAGMIASMRGADPSAAADAPDGVIGRFEYPVFRDAAAVQGPANHLHAQPALARRRSPGWRSS